ncbi:hypothetical protein CDAR_247341 [Caerostris darwini]|uniref:Uncharacterized protein n=1 Tax=Caerostris darwini TaxID=1538125 RepID=A0AAV4MEG1_9ARAC|nr:hypothetical protein CDAR_247341 [Caerostris darwini]
MATGHLDKSAIVKPVTPVDGFKKQKKKLSDVPEKSIFKILVENTFEAISESLNIENTQRSAVSTVSKPPSYRFQIRILVRGCKAFLNGDPKKGQAIPQYKTSLQLQKNQNIIKPNVSLFTQLFKTAHTSQPQIPPITEVPDSSDLFTALQLLKELQYIMNAFT